MNIINKLIAAITLFSMTLLSSHAVAGPSTQLGFILDGSGSVSSSNYDLLRSGLSDAIAALTTDGSIEITVTAYGSNTTTVVAPTLLTAATLAAIQSAILTHVKAGGGTDTAGALRYTTSLLTNSVYFSDAGLKASILNLATDGIPNDQTAAVDAAAYAYSQGIDALSIEAIGSGVNSGTQLNAMLAIAFPGPATLLGLNSTTIPNPVGGSWVVPVSDFDALAPVLKAKVIASVTPTNPVPASSPFSVMLAGLFAVVWLRRRIA